jgi:predicted N-acetyltransferase YhbS
LSSPDHAVVRASGLRALDLVTALLQRARRADPAGGLWEAADFQWWWRSPRRSDALEQSFWLDGVGPVGAVMLTDWGRVWGCDPIILPDAAPGLAERVWVEAIARSQSPGMRDAVVETLVRDDDAVGIARLTAAGFEATDDRGGMTWMGAGDRPVPEPPPSGFELIDRAADPRAPHWISRRSGIDAEARLQQVSLYDPWLDLAIRAPDAGIAGYALFWFDPITRVGLVEPMRVEDAWQRRGLARSLLTNGLDRLARKGATRLKVGWGSPPGRALYFGSGFREEVTTTSYSRKPGAPSGDSGRPWSLSRPAETT